MFSFPLIFPVACIAFASLLTLSSLSFSLFWHQLIWYAMGFGFFFVFHFIDWRPLINRRSVGWVIYAFVIALLVATFFFAPTIRGTRSWLVLGPFQIQAAELAKGALIIVFAQYFARKHIGIAKLQHLVVPFLYFLVPAALILLQPDMGSTLILFGIWFGFLLVSGLPLRHLAAFGVLFLVGGVLLWSFFLKDYQRDRLIGLFVPDRDPLGVNYNVIQSKIAIGSAGLLGKGYGQGSQIQLGFLPEAKTDFIFSAFIEEWGIISGILLVGAFIFLIHRILRVGMKAERNFEKFICLGTAIMLIIHFLINAGEAVGFMPVIGVTFPFLSYGGSSILINFFLLGIIHSIAARA
jgi:rod shape determining protein RodA